MLHNQLRLAVMSLLVAVEEGDFNFLLEKTGATRGNLSVQITKLKEADYIRVKKTFKDNYPNTMCSVSPKGLGAFEAYVAAIKEYLKT
ncbi:MAG TPA: transcriptional regulator [Flavobacteriales bacterium]|nr:transcriptional regulator [Flavobacteriales bacterium]